MEKLKIQMIDCVTLALVLVLFTTQFIFPSITFASISKNVDRYTNNLVTLPYEFTPALAGLVEIAAEHAMLLPVSAREFNDIEDDTEEIEDKNFGNLPSAMNKEPVETWNIIATAYSSDVWQTDDTPCITANMFNVCEAPKPQQYIIANNCLRFETKVSFPSLYGNQVFIVKDRMNARYGCERVDLWMHGREQAKFFGVKYGKMHIHDENAEIPHRSILNSE